MRNIAPEGGCAPPGAEKQTAVPGVKARNGRGCKAVTKPLAHFSNHKAPTLTRQTLIALFNDEGAFIGFDLFGERSEARAFMRAGGAG